MSNSHWFHELRRGGPRRRAVGMVLAVLAVAQVVAMTAAPTTVDATTPTRTRLSTGVPDAVAPEIVAVGRTLHSVWADAGLIGAPSRGVGYRRSLDAGTTWSPMVHLDLHDGKGHAERPRVAADGDIVAVTWSETTSKDVLDAGNRQIWATVSTDAGRSFRPPFRVDADRADSLAPLVAVRGDDVWIAWGDLNGDVHIATSHDRGDTFDRDQLVDGYGSPLTRDGLAVDGATVAVTWLRNEGERNKDVDVRVSQDRGDTWGEIIPIADTPDFVWDWDPVVAAAEGSVYVFWSGSGRQLVRTSVDGGITFGPPVDLGPAFGLASVTARNGLVAAAWSDRERRGVRVATSTGDGIWSPSLVAGPQSGRPVIAVPQDATDGGPRASFTWSMPERFGMDRNGDGLVDERQDAAYIAPPFWTVRFDGCASTAGVDDPDGVLTYAWTLDGEPFGGNECSFQHEFTEEASHTVRLEVTRASGRTDTATHTVEVDDLLIFSLGDSVASGEGNADIPGSGPWPWSDDSIWQDRQCNRSAKAGPALAAAEIERRDPRHSVTFVHLACSGATVYGPDNSTGGLLSPYEGINPDEGDLLAPQIEQLEQIAAGREIDAVFVSIGANDLHFSGVVAGCLANMGCYEDDEGIKVEFDRRLAELPEHYERLAHQFERLGIDEVYITEYFDPTVDHNGAWNLSCAANLGQAGLSDSEARWAADHVMGNLNGSVRAAAETYGWHYVGDIATRFHGHGYCAEDSYVVQLGDSFSSQSDKNGAFHPNNAGHEIYGERIAQEFEAGRQPAVEAPDAPEPTNDDWSGDLYLAWGDRNVMVTTLRADGGPATPMRTVNVSNSSSTLGTRFVSLAASEHGAFVAWDESDAIDPRNYLGHWHAYVAPAVRAAPDLAVTSASLTQAADGADFLVAGKSTAIRTEIVSTLRSAQTVYVRYQVRDGNGGVVTSGTVPVAISPGHNDVYLEGELAPLVPLDGTWWADVQVDPDGLVAESDEDNNAAATDELTIRTSRNLSTLYIPVGGASCATATGLAASSSPWLHAVLPVADGALTQHTDCSYAMPGTNATDDGLVQTLAILDSMALLSGYDTAVGVVPAGWLQAPTGGAVGLGLYGDPAPSGAPAGGILVEQGQGPSVIAHEIGHNFGLEHTVEQEASGYWVVGGTEQDGIDFMDMFTQQKPWVGGLTWSTLMDRFQLTAEWNPLAAQAARATANRSLLVRGTIAPDGTVDVPVWYQTDQAPDVALGSTANLVLEYLDANGAVIDSAGVHASTFEALGGEGPAGWMSFGARVPWIDGTATLVLRASSGGPALVERAVTSAAPTVTLLSPTATTWTAIGADLDVRWTATDADGLRDEDLRTALTYSTDGGVTFKPIAIDLEGTEWTWSIGDHLAGKPVQLRLDVSDGVHTTSVVSEVFTVGGTPPSGEPRLAVIRNVQPEFGGAPYTHLFTMRPDGTDLQHVETIGDYVWDPHWSPDGQRIAFTTDGPDDEYVTEWDVYSVRPDGSELTNLTPPPIDQGMDWRFQCPQWHPDGSKVLVHVSKRDNYAINELAWAAADGSGVTTVATGVPFGFYGCPRLSPDGTHVVYGDGAGIHALDLATGTRTLLLAKPSGGSVSKPIWTPDGATIIAKISTGASGAPGVPANYWGLVKAPVDGSGVMTPFLSLSGFNDPFNAGRTMSVEDPRFTPDGNTILFHSWDGRIQYSEAWKFRLSCRMNVDATGVTCLQDVRLSALGGGFFEADLSPAGSATPPPPPWTDPAPVVEPPAGEPAAAGGPYEAVEDEPVRLDAGASALATGGGVPLAEWDLDDDGDFDDAIGLHVTAQFEDAGIRPVRVRITADDGQVAEASTTADVAPAPPAVIAPAPATVSVDRPFTLSGASFRDPGLGGHTATASWGDGSTTPLGVPIAESGPLEGEHEWSTPGTYPVEITVCDEGTSVCATSATTVTVVTRSGTPPVASDTAVRTPAGHPVMIPLAASDAQGDVVDRSITVAPVHGEITRIVGDMAEYRPDGGFTGVDTFTWVANDVDGVSAPATVTVVVGNTAPAAGDDAVEVEAGTTLLLETERLLDNDVDADGDDLRLAGAYAGVGMAGAVERTADGVRFTAPNGFDGTTTFDYAVSDGNGGIDFATVTVEVNAAEVPPTTTPPPPPSTPPPVTTPTNPTTAPQPTPPTSDTVSVPPMPAPIAVPTVPAPPTTVPPGGLPATGASVLGMLALATALVVVGSITRRVRRRPLDHR